MREWFFLQTAALIVGFIIDCFVGDPYCIPHPVIGIGKWISFFDKKLRRGNSNPKDVSCGAVTVILVALISRVCLKSRFLLQSSYFLMTKFLFFKEKTEISCVFYELKPLIFSCKKWIIRLFR